MKTTLFAILAAGAVILTACGSKSAPAADFTPIPPAAAVASPTSVPAAPPAAQVDPAIADAILAVIDANLRAAQAEDIDAFMATIDPDSPVYDATRSQMQQIFADFDLTYEVSDLVIVSASESEATVSFVQTTRKVSGPDFRDNQLKGEHVLHNRDGGWFIYDSLPLDIVYLD